MSRAVLHAKTRRLEEAGLLVRSSRPAPCAPDADLGPEHRLSEHHSVWPYVAPRFQRPYAGDKADIELFREVPPGTPLREALAATRLYVFLGSAPSETLRLAAGVAGAVILVFEPDYARFLEHVDGLELDSGRHRARVFCLCGDPEGLPWSLYRLFPTSLFQLGFPLFFVQQGLARACPEYVDGLALWLEVYYYRERVYPLHGHWNQRGLPLRDMERNLFYDQLKHLYENVPDYLGKGALDDLRGTCAGATALCVGAGPDLDRRLDYLRGVRDRCVLICVNNALRVLLGAGLVPDFVVINDASVDVESSYQGLPELPDTALVAHCYSPTSPVFGRVFFFGDALQSMLAPRGELEYWGSVITTTVSLAEVLGCSRVVLAGAQLASPEPYSMHYSSNTALGDRLTGVRSGMTHRYPQLYPVTSARGETMYANLNFLDTRFWFLEYIRGKDLEVVNLASDSILYGPGVTVDEHYDPPRDAARPPVPTHVAYGRREDDVPALLGYLREERDTWRMVLEQSKACLDALAKVRDGGGAREAVVEQAGALVAAYDRSNVSYLVQRFEDFSNPWFHARFFEGADDGERLEGLNYFFYYTLRMSKEFLAILDHALGRVERPAAG
jgi:hypothetical protein